MREIRCFLQGAEDQQTTPNSWAGSSATGELGAFWSVRVTVQGAVHDRTGYVCAISELESAIFGHAIPLLRSCALDEPITIDRVGAALTGAFPAVDAALPRAVSLDALEVRVSPFLVLVVMRGDQGMVHLTQSFEFSASHRLYCDTMNEEENRRVFGKCANPNGHGHNYVVDVTIRGTPHAQSGTLLPLPVFEQTMKERVIDRFDHKHLNLDCSDFETINPSVENIARVIWRHLEGAFEPSRLDRVRVWETPKTYADYTGD